MPVAAKELLPPNNKRSPSDLNTTPSLNQLKKPFLGSQENTTTTTSNSPNSFHRCFSGPCSKPVASQLALQSPLDSSKMVGTNAASLPSQPALRRSVSDPSPNESCSRSSSFKMRDSMKEINQLWEEIIMPVDEEPPCENHEEYDKGTELENINAIKSDSETDCEESVTVKKNWGMIDYSFQVLLWHRLSDSSLWKKLLLQTHVDSSLIGPKSRYQFLIYFFIFRQVIHSLGYPYFFRVPKIFRVVMLPSKSKVSFLD